MILARCSEDFELTLAALLNLWRITNTTPPPYSTATGRGYNSKQQGLEAITSFVLACILNDPKNTAKLVPAVGNLTMAKVGTATKRIYPDITDDHSPMSILSGNRDHTVLVDRVKAPFTVGTLFALLCFLAHQTAYHWGEEEHFTLRKHFKLTIQVSPRVSAELTWMLDAEGRSQTFNYYSLSKKRKAQPKVTIPARNVVMTFDHIEMIADLYRDTLAHEAAAKEPEPKTSLTLDAENDVPKNEEGGAPRKAPPTRNTRTTAKQSQGRNIPEIKTERASAQPCRADGLVTFHCEG
ncbi:MAG: hypothetical protein ACRYF2_12840 [Janthinobacterium lividum]